jgi:hypothetical protein
LNFYLRSKKMKAAFYLIMIFVALLAAGCTLPGEPAVEPPAPLLDPTYTVEAGTLTARLTQNVPSPTQTVPPAITTPQPAATSLPTGTPSETPTLVQASPTLTATAVITGQVAITLTPSATPGTTQLRLEDLNLVYADNFSTANDSWVSDEAGDWQMGYIKGAYRIFVNLLNDAVWSVKNIELGDTVMEVDVARSSGPDTGYFGLVCRHLDAGHYYLLVIGPDGYYGIGKKDLGRLTFLKEGRAPAEILRPGGEINRVRVDCVSNRLALYVNGTILVEAQDASYGAGDIGLVVGTREQEGMEVIFDNFAAYEP